MRVMLINSYKSGSTGRIAAEIQKFLIQNGHDCLFAFGFGKVESENEYAISNNYDFRFHTYSTLLTGLHGYNSFICTLKLIKKIDSFAPDIVHLHNLHGGYINIPLLLNHLKRKNYHTLITLHDCWLFTGKCYHFYEAGCYKWKESCGNCPQLTMYPKSLFFDRTKKMLKDKKKWFKNFKHLEFTAVSDWLRETAMQSFLSDYKFTTIYNGIDTAKFYPRNYDSVNKKYNLDGKFVILGVASSWNVHKGLSDFLKLSEQLSENEIIVLVGVTDKIKTSLPANCIGILRTDSQEELAELYSRADVFFNASKEEAFGLVTAEALSCGTPVVVYKSTACPETLTHQTGLIIEKQNNKHLIDHIHKALLADFDAQLCRTHIKNNFSKEKMLSGYQAVYNNIEKRTVNNGK